MANDQQQKVTSVEDLLAMVDLGTSSSPEPTASGPAASASPILAHKHPILDAFLDCVDAWRDVMGASGLAKVGHGLKYTALFSAFTNRFSGAFGQDNLGQYANLDHGQKLRPIDAQDHALFFRAVRYRIEG